METPTSITRELSITRPERGTESLPSQTRIGPPITVAVAVEREKTLTARTAPFKGAVYTSLYSELVSVDSVRGESFECLVVVFGLSVCSVEYNLEE